MSQRGAAAENGVAQQTLSHRLAKVTNVGHPTKTQSSTGVSGDRDSAAKAARKLQRVQLQRGRGSRWATTPPTTPTWLHHLQAIGGRQRSPTWLSTQIINAYCHPFNDGFTHPWNREQMQRLLHGALIRLWRSAALYCFRVVSHVGIGIGSASRSTNRNCNSAQKQTNLNVTLNK
jgi:hypothetical protein